MILREVMETDPVKECHDSNSWSNPRACGQQVKQEAKVPESRSDQEFDEENPVVAVDLKIR